MAAHILVVEDEPLARDAMAALLRDEGYRVTTASSGREAIVAIERDLPDLLISDVRMPGGDGLSLVRVLRSLSRTAQLPVVLMSAHAESERQVAGLDVGADDFVAKPVDPAALCARVRVQLRRAGERHRLERRAVMDALTGVLNRRGIAGVVRRELQVSARRRTALSVLMVDVDRFKAINDRHGHAMGDTVLRHVARVLGDAVRIADHVGRCGGDEFLVVLPDTDEAAATALAGRLGEVRLPPLAVEGGPDLVVTISIGAATHRPGETVDALLERADQAMYRIKRASEPAFRPA